MKKYFRSKAAIKAGRTTKAGRIRRKAYKELTRWYRWRAFASWWGPFGKVKVVRYVD
jgi:hypothetical protein